jgi:hypothetical protein
VVRPIDRAATPGAVYPEVLTRSRGNVVSLFHHRQRIFGRRWLRDRSGSRLQCNNGNTS